jgi:hypothetical protein
MLSTDELRIHEPTPVQAPRRRPRSTGDADRRRRWQPSRGKTAAVAYRLWRRHPRYSMLADSTMQGVLDLCEELVLLTQAVRARARSRLAGRHPVVPTRSRTRSSPAERRTRTRWRTRS